MQYPTIAQPQYGFAPTMPMMPSMSDMPPAMMANGGLVAAAKDVQSKGRGNDTMLVHMTPGEVGGLQALAMQHGGSLTINPKTGLPEAGFLDNLLPTLLGVGASFLFPAASPYLIGAGVGGVEALRTGDLGKGLLAGLGAFGGANLGASFGAAGAAGTTAAGAGGATAAGAGGTAGLEFANAASPEFLASQGVGTAGATGAGVSSSLGTTINPVTFGDTGAAIYGGTASPAMQAANLAVDPMAVPGFSGQVVTGAQAAPSFSANAARAGQGVQNVFASGDTGTAAREAFLKSSGGYSGLARDAAMAAAPALMAGPEYAPPSRTEEESNYKGPYTPSERRVTYPDDDLRRRTSEYTYFTPSNPVPFAEGGKIEEDRAVRMPGADYVAGQMPEFNHNFKPVEFNANPMAMGNVGGPRTFDVNGMQVAALNEADIIPEGQLGSGLQRFAPIASNFFGAEIARRTGGPNPSPYAQDTSASSASSMSNYVYDPRTQSMRPAVGFDKGGKVEEDRSIKMPGADYVAGRMPEFNHGFKPVSIEGRNEFGMTPEQMNAYTMGEALSRMGGEGGPPGIFGTLFKKAGQQMKDSASEYTDLSGYEYDPRTQRLVKSSSTGGLPALARGGSVPTLENGGFVLTKKAVDGLGKGSNKKGQKVASRGLGAIPIKGPGTGTSDSIKTSIDGKRPALVSNGEAYVPKKQVAKHGGAKKFYALMKKAERRA